MVAAPMQPSKLALHDATASMIAMALAVTGEAKQDTDDRARRDGNPV
jgi:hypothetical protein